MTRSVLLDANMLIGAFDPEPGNMQHESAAQRLRELLSDPGVKLAISPLIRYEVLRGVRRVSPEILDAQLNEFQEFEVRGQDARRAAQIFRLAKQKGVAIDKRGFDVFHCVCAELNGLEIDSQDSDVSEIMKLFVQVI